MPHIIVLADGDSGADGSVMLRERITPSDLQSRHFADHLIERLNWAVEDAREVEQSVAARGTHAVVGHFEDDDLDRVDELPQLTV